ncbi:hypothetical protein [uncultured Methanobrevibacter sp.]|nr:hypothetical protein [uncultured Methanobrevibacter sp.]
MNIMCNREILKVTVNFKYKIHEKEFNETINSRIANNFNLPQMELASE